MVIYGRQFTVHSRLRVVAVAFACVLTILGRQALLFVVGKQTRWRGIAACAGPIRRQKTQLLNSPKEEITVSRKHFIDGWSSLALGSMGWAGWLGQLGTRGSGQDVSELDEAGAAAVRLGLGAERVEDARNWELTFFSKTLDSVRQRCPPSSQLLFHYTDLASAEVILSGRRGLRLSRGGYKGGGVFFSQDGPLADQDLAKNGSMLWKDAFPAFQAKQLQRNYGSDILGRQNKVDAVLLCIVPTGMIQLIPDRSNAAFIPLDYFEVLSANYFPIRNIPRVYRLSPR
eukprot:TRINITY_DN87675_c0_g1_i1.p1 TRINITY_DN87675_c0_g1~~TRINITY_DN87675_c0_g1_i1.p1  ORF type:complete len:325 (-),score=38.81 TRINITY_DN87675_c0_g1_i1:83-940(-)